MRRYLLFIVALLFVIGILLGYYFIISIPAIVTIFIIVITIHRRHEKKFIFWFLLFVIFCGGCFRVAYFKLYEIEYGLDHSIGQDIDCGGYIIDNPKKLEDRVSFTVSQDGIRMQINVRSYEQYFYGDYVSCLGRLKRTNKGSLLKSKVFYEVQAKSVDIISSNNGYIVIKYIYEIKRLFIEKLYSIFSSPHGELIAGLTIEGSDSISKELKESFRRTSLSHIVALSGTNVSIIIEVVFILLSRFNRWPRFTISFAFIVIFAIMTGLSSTILRASLMAFISLLADLFHRKYEPLRALLLSSVIMTAFNPLILFFDLSFQLSFMATLSMILIMPILNKSYLRFIPFKIIRETVTTTLSAQILIIPLILFYMGNISTIFLISNLLVLPMVPVAMLFGALTVSTSFFWPVMNIFSLLGHLSVSYIISVVENLSAISFAVYDFKIDLYTLYTVYVIIFLVLGFIYRKSFFR